MWQASILFKLMPYAATVLITVSLTSLYYNNKINKERARQAEELAQSSETALENYKESISKLEQQRDNALKNYGVAKNETDRLRTAVVNQSVGLRVKARCDNGETSGTESTSSRLDRESESAYFALRADIDEVNKLLDLCGVPK